MKLRILVGSLLWLTLITALHVQLNVGWEQAAARVHELFGGERKELYVGFLPVT
jgi:hypothetical protein